MFRIAPHLAALSAAALLAGPAPAAAGSAGDPSYEWLLSRYTSDGAGGFDGPELVDSGTQEAGILSESVVLAGGSPHAEVFGSLGAADFWGFARSPLTGGAEDQPIGARAELRVSRVFRKDAEDATLSFVIPDSELSVSHFFGPPNEGVSALLVHSVEAGDFFAFSEQAVLEGVGGAFAFTSDANLLPYELAQGGLGQGAAGYRFSEPYEQAIDLSSVGVGEEFAVVYRVIADALDTVQAKSGARAVGRDPLDPEVAVRFEFDGLSPIGAPEPGAPLLLATGAALFAARARRRPCRARP